MLTVMQKKAIKLSIWLSDFYPYDNEMDNFHEELIINEMILSPYHL